MNAALLELVDHIYEGAVRPTAWPAIVEHMAGFFGTTRAALFSTFVGPSQGGLGILYGVPEAALRRWGDEFLATDDVWAQAAIRQDKFRAGLAFRGTDLIPESELRASRIYRELLQHVGIGQMCTGVIFDGSGDVLPTTCGVYRPLDEPPFGEETRAAMTALLAHFSRALGVMYRLRDAEFNLAVTLGALDRVQSGIALLDARGIIRNLNREAERLIALDDGLTRKAIEDAARPALEADPLRTPHFSDSQQLARASGKAPFVLQFAPLPAANEFSGAVRAIAFITDPEAQARLDATLLQQLYGITPAEARLAERLCAGDTLAAAAARCAIGEATAKTHLARLFERTNTSRQADLLRLLLSLRAK